MGATETITITSAAKVRTTLRYHYPGGFDVVFDAIGAIDTISLDIDLLGLIGPQVVVRLSSSGSVLAILALYLAMSNQRILESNYGSFDSRNRHSTHHLTSTKWSHRGWSTDHVVRRLWTLKVGWRTLQIVERYANCL